MQASIGELAPIYRQGFSKALILAHSQHLFIPNPLSFMNAHDALSEAASQQFEVAHRIAAA
jgi:hypothetical protein